MERPLSQHLVSVQSLSLVTSDCDAAAARWAKVYGLGPWSIADDALDAAQPSRAPVLHIARTTFGSLPFELLESRSDPPWLRCSGRSADRVHVSLAAGHYESALAAYRNGGIPILGEITLLGRKIALLDTREDLGFVVRLVGPSGDTVARSDDRIVPGPSAGPVFGNIVQIGIVCRSIEDSAGTWLNRHGIGPWRVYELPAPSDVEARARGRLTSTAVDGEPCDYGMRIALCAWAGLSWELIEPLDARSDYARFLKLQNGAPAMHHVLCESDSYAGAIAALTARGAAPRQSGNLLGTSFSYFDVPPSGLGFAVEFSDVRPGFTLDEPDLVIG